MRILLIEHGHSGHRFPNVRLLLPSLCALSGEVTLAIPKSAVGTEEYRSQLASFEGHVDIDAWLPEHSQWSAWYKPREVLEAVRRSRAEYVFIPHADGYAQAMGLHQILGKQSLHRHTEMEGLLMRGSFAYPQSGIGASLRVKASMRLVMRGQWDRLHLLDPFVYRILKSRGGAFADRLSLLPDPVPPMVDIPRKEARKRLGLPENGRYVVAAGSLDRRKGTDVLIHAFKKANLAEDDRLLLVGRLSPEMRELVDRDCKELLLRDRVITANRFISDVELNLAVTASDVVCTPYRHHIGSASIAIRAAAAQRFLLSTDYGWLGHIVPLFGLGSVCHSESVDELARELTHSLDQAPAHVWREPAIRFAAFHSESNFRAAWTDRLRERLGRPHDERRLSWDYVMESVHEQHSGSGRATGGSSEPGR